MTGYVENYEEILGFSDIIWVLWFLNHVRRLRSNVERSRAENVN